MSPTEGNLTTCISGGLGKADHQTFVNFTHNLTTHKGVFRFSSNSTYLNGRVVRLDIRDSAATTSSCAAWSKPATEPNYYTYTFSNFDSCIVSGSTYVFDLHETKLRPNRTCFETEIFDRVVTSYYRFTSTFLTNFLNPAIAQTPIVLNGPQSISVGLSTLPSIETNVMFFENGVSTTEITPYAQNITFVFTVRGVAADYLSNTAQVLVATKITSVDFTGVSALQRTSNFTGVAGTCNVDTGSVAPNCTTTIRFPMGIRCLSDACFFGQTNSMFNVHFSTEHKLRRRRLNNPLDAAQRSRLSFKNVYKLRILGTSVAGTSVAGTSVAGVNVQSDLRRLLAVALGACACGVAVGEVLRRSIVGGKKRRSVGGWVNLNLKPVPSIHRRRAKPD